MRIAFAAGDTYSYRSTSTLEVVTWTRDDQGVWTCDDGREATVTDADIPIEDDLRAGEAIIRRHAPNPMANPMANPMGGLREEIKKVLRAELDRINNSPSGAQGGDVRITTLSPEFSAKAAAQVAEMHYREEIARLNSSIDSLLASTRRMANDRNDADRLNGHLARLLNEVANALHGGEHESGLVMWDWSDLAQRVEAERRLADLLAQRLSQVPLSERDDSMNAALTDWSAHRAKDRKTNG